MRKTVKTILMTSAVWIVFIIIAIPFFFSGDVKETGYEMSDYQTSDHARSINYSPFEGVKGEYNGGLCPHE